MSMHELGRGPAGVAGQDVIRLTGLSGRGYHGVLPAERAEGQLFSVDLAIGLGQRGAGAAAVSDSVERTVDYSRVASVVVGLIEGEPVNLIETLASRVADAVLAFAGVQVVEVTVHKPQAPLEVAFEDVSVTLVRAAGVAGTVGADAGGSGDPARTGAVLGAVQELAPEQAVDAAGAEPGAAQEAGADGGSAAEDCGAQAVDAGEGVASSGGPVPSDAARGGMDALAGGLAGGGLAGGLGAGAAGVAGGAAMTSGEALASAGAAGAAGAAGLAGAVVDAVGDVLAEDGSAVAGDGGDAEPAEGGSSLAGPAEVAAAENADGTDGTDAAEGADGADGADGAEAREAENEETVSSQPPAPGGAEDAGAAVAEPAEPEADAAPDEHDRPSTAAAEPADEDGESVSPEEPVAGAAALGAAGGAAGVAALGAGTQAEPHTQPETAPASAAPETAEAEDVLARRPVRPVPAVIALGGNVGGVVPALRKAVHALSSTDGIRVDEVAPLARTAAVVPEGSEPQPDYLNTVVLLTTTLSPRELLVVCQQLESEAGRVRLTPKGPRTLDADLITVAGVRSADPQLTLPHPRAAQRAFVLAPWAQADPFAELGEQSVAALAEAAPDRPGVRWMALDWLDSDHLPALPTGQYVAPPLAGDDEAEPAQAEPAALPGQADAPDQGASPAAADDSAPVPPAPAVPVPPAPAAETSVPPVPPVPPAPADTALPAEDGDGDGEDPAPGSAPAPRFGLRVPAGSDGDDEWVAPPSWNDVIGGQSAGQGLGGPGGR